jgi:hypothetical protein
VSQEDRLKIVFIGDNVLPPPKAGTNSKQLWLLKGITCQIEGRQADEEGRATLGNISGSARNHSHRDVCDVEWVMLQPTILWDSFKP